MALTPCSSSLRPRPGRAGDCSGRPGLGLDALVEVHDEAEAEVALDAGPKWSGSTSGTLVTSRSTPRRAVGVAGSLPGHMVRVAESGVRP